MSRRIAIQEKIPGIVAAFLASLIAWIVTREALSSLLIGLVTEQMALLLELQVDLTRTRGIIAETLSISEAAATSESLKRFIADYDTVERARGSLFKNEADRVLLQSAEKMADLKRGRITLRGEDAYFRGVGILETAEKEFLVTDVVTNPDKWSRGEVQSWHKANIKAATGGLRITRFFLVRDKEFLAQGSPIMTTMKEQNDAGIDVRYVLFDELDPDLIRDCGLLDDNISITSQFTPAGKFELFRLDTSPTLVNDTRDYFKRIGPRSHSFTDLKNALPGR